MNRLSTLSDEALAAMAAKVDIDLPAAPGWLVESAVAMWRAPAAVPTLGERIAAVLRFDSWARQAVPSLRSAAQEYRQLLFTADGRDFDLRIVADQWPAGPATRFVIEGQVLGAGDDGEMLLTRTDAMVARAPLDEFGEFRFRDLAPGRYAIALQFGADRIDLPVIDVGGDSHV